MDDEYPPIPPSSAAAGEEIMELLWQDGTPVVIRCSGQGGGAVIPADQPVQQQHSFMQEDETASWLQYALDESTFDRDSYVDLFNSPPPHPTAIVPPHPTAIVPPPFAAEIRPPPSPGTILPRLHNFIHFSRIDPMSLPAETAARGLTVAESNETPVNTAANMESVDVTRQISLSSSGGSGSTTLCTSVEPTQPPQTAAADRKRKGREDDCEYQSEETEFNAAEEAKKQARGPKKSRSVEVHNLSERKRRDRINEKMKALQELIPGSNKTDKASMLDEAIEYFKSLQMQVQMMSNMGCGMVPMMYPGMQQYMHAMGMGMSMSRPVMPYPSLLAGPTMPNLGAATHMGGPRFPIPAAPFHLPQVPVPDPSRVQSSNQADPSDQRVLNFVDPYQQYLGLQQAQPTLPQDQAGGQSSASASKPSTSKQNSKPEN